MYRYLIGWLRRNPLARAASRLLDPPMRRKIVYRLRQRDRARTIENALAGRIANLDDIEAFILANPVRLCAPLILISQAHRSGGTLLSQLFDGHSAVAAHPAELKLGRMFGRRKAEHWPRLDPSLGAEENFRLLYEGYTSGLMRVGYSKGERDSTRRRFFLVPRVQRRVFVELFRAFPPKQPRDILDHFFTAYFNAWLNYRGNLAQKRWVSAFSPRLAHHEESVAAFFASYPDGRLIQIVRDPKTWYPSARHHGGENAVEQAPEQILDVWCTSTESILRNQACHGDKVIVLRFEDLVAHTDSTMRWLAKRLGISFEPSLVKPTFNGEPTRANSSFAVGESGIIDSPLARAAMLSDHERRLIEDRCRVLYERVLEGAQRVAA